MRDLGEEARIEFRRQLVEARARAAADAEDFHDILTTVERLGAWKRGRTGGGLGRYTKALSAIADESPLSREAPPHRSAFTDVLDTVRAGRNEAMHQGVWARHLTSRAIELSLTLEDALASKLQKVEQVMIRDTVTAEPWMPLSLVRQRMLGGNFSALPVRIGESWLLVTAFQVARAKRSGATALDTSLSDLVAAKVLELEQPVQLQGDMSISEAIGKLRGDQLAVVLDPADLAGVLMAFDVM